MTRAALESLDKEALIQLVLAQVSVIERLTERVAELEARLGKPPTPGERTALAGQQGLGAGGDESQEQSPSRQRPIVGS